MKIGRLKVAIGLSLVATLIMSGCGGSSSNPPALDITAPEFTSLSQIDVNEQTQLNHVVKAIDASGDVSYSKDGGANEEFFEIDTKTGVLTFLAPEVEEDISYKVNIKATDKYDNNKTQFITITIKNVLVDDVTSPIFTSASELNITENVVLNYTLTATDASGSVRFSKDATGENEELFTLSQEGVLVFSTPAVDSDMDYKIRVKAEDLAGNTKMQEITIFVKEAGEITNRAIMPMNTEGVFVRDSAKNTVLNTKTGFIWEDSAINDDNITFAQAKAHCEELKNSKFASIDDWKLPSRNDLFKLVDYSSGTGNFMDDTFINSASGAYWSNEEDGNNTWAVIYAGGTGDFRVSKTLEPSLNHTITSAYVRCVSGDHQPAKFSPLKSDDTREDFDSGLIWKSYDANGVFQNDQNWSEASSACQAQGFRLPNINELRSIVNYASGEVFGELTIITDNNITHSARTEDNGFGGNVWTNVINNGGKIKTLYITKLKDASPTSKDLIQDSSLDANESSYYIKTLCVK